MVSQSDIKRWREYGAITALDSIRSLPHLSETCLANTAHANRHLSEAIDALKTCRGGGGEATLASVAWNIDHSFRHFENIKEHADKIIKHINQHRKLLSGKLPSNVLNSYLSISKVLSDQAANIIKKIELSYRLMPRAYTNDRAYEQLNDLFSQCNFIAEDINKSLKRLIDLVCSNELTHEELLRLVSYSKLPQKTLNSNMPIKAYLDETLNLLES